MTYQFSVLFSLFLFLRRLAGSVREMILGVGSPFSDFLRPFLEAGSSFSPNLLVDPGVGSNFFGIFSAPVNFFVDLGVGNSFSCFLRSTFGVVRIFSSFRAVVFGPGPGADVRTQDPKGYVACSKPAFSHR